MLIRSQIMWQVYTKALAVSWINLSSPVAGSLPRAGDTLGADCVTWIQVEFLNASSNVLALYKSGDFSASVGAGTWFPYQVTNACDLSQPVATGDPYFTTYAVTGAVSQLVAPLGTTAVRYRYAHLAVNGTGSAFLDDAVLRPGQRTRFRRSLTIFTRRT